MSVFCVDWIFKYSGHHKTSDYLGNWQIIYSETRNSIFKHFIWKIIGWSLTKLSILSHMFTPIEQHKPLWENEKKNSNTLETWLNPHCTWLILYRVFILLVSWLLFSETYEFALIPNWNSVCITRCLE